MTTTRFKFWIENQPPRCQNSIQSNFPRCPLTVPCVSRRVLSVSVASINHMPPLVLRGMPVPLFTNCRPVQASYKTRSGLSYMPQTLDQSRCPNVCSRIVGRCDTVAILSRVIYRSLSRFGRGSVVVVTGKPQYDRHRCDRHSTSRFSPPVSYQSLQLYCLGSTASSVR